jgi:hypothetical protein
MAPDESSKPPLFSKPYRSTEWHCPDWSDRSNGVPEYVIRTGSKKSMDIKEDHGKKGGDCLSLPISNYASYVLQSGCFTWTGR